MVNYNISEAFVYDVLTEYSLQDRVMSSISGDLEYKTHISIRGLLMRLALKYKRIILAIPLLRNIARFYRKKIYNVMPFVTVSSLFNVEKYLELNSNDFIKTMYKKMLGRDPEPDDIDKYMRFYQKGGSKEAIIYALYKDIKFNRLFKIKNIGKYKREYLTCNFLIKLRKIFHRHP